MSQASASHVTLSGRGEQPGSSEQATADVLRRGHVMAGLRVLPLVLALLIFTLAGVYQLQLPGLHYDEAKEAGVNAMQLLTGQPVTAFRDATLNLGRLRIPLMVQDYIGNFNVLLAIPFLGIGGINTIALRALPLVLAALTLFLTWKIADRLGGPLVAGIAALLLAVNPTFIFWSRQGIFVTNITALFFMASLWFGLLWWEQRRPRHLILAALFCGLGVYAKLLFVWAAIALFLVATFALLVERLQRGRWSLPKLSTLVLAGLAFALPLIPLILFNLQTGGTFTSIFGHLGRSYYGVDNSAYGTNLLARFGQLVVLMRGAHFWYLGGTNANEYAPWLLLALVLLAAAAWASRTRAPANNSRSERSFFTPALPLALLILIVLQSAFTVSDLFITHFVLLTSLIPLIAALSAGEILRWAKGRTHLVGRLAAGTALAMIVAWIATDAYTTALYHHGLTVSGGHSAHSDAIYRLAEYLDQKGYRSPVVLDWGIDAPVRFLTADRVQPIEVFGYGRIDQPDADFLNRLAPYLADWKTLYVSHASGQTVFKGRDEAVAALQARGKKVFEQIRFGERSGEWVFFIRQVLD